MSKPVFILNGPNLNMLGQREPDIYGHTTLDDIAALCRSAGARLGLDVECRQSNHEGDLVDWVQEANAKGSALIVNAGAYTHTSVALLDALKAVAIPVVEIHLSNIFSREAFRHHSYVSPAANGIICGFGAKGYELGLEAVAEILSER
ncbi:MAG: type II 3-dehydroquinate dehydratase [Fimbriimonadaceae bacterium]|nr:type II 3-dehydroquinate dehydratase [Alphaproteobacteria bacterium]